MEKQQFNIKENAETEQSWESYINTDTQYHQITDELSSFVQEGPNQQTSDKLDLQPTEYYLIQNSSKISNPQVYQENQNLLPLKENINIDLESSNPPSSEQSIKVDEQSQNSHSIDESTQTQQETSNSLPSEESTQDLQKSRNILPQKIQKNKRGRKKIPKEQKQELSQKKKYHYDDTRKNYMKIFGNGLHDYFTAVFSSLKKKEDIKQVVDYQKMSKQKTQVHEENKEKKKCNNNYSLTHLRKFFLGSSPFLKEIMLGYYETKVFNAINEYILKNVEEEKQESFQENMNTCAEFIRTKLEQDPESLSHFPKRNERRQQ